MKLLAADIKDIFGQISPPPAIKTFIGSDTTGTQGISRFLSNLIALFYTGAAIVLIFMLVWGAWDWLTSEGDKEKIAGARNKIISAVIGIALFAAAFAVIAVLGQFTGFKFFEGQNYKVMEQPTSTSTSIRITCSGDGKVYTIDKKQDPYEYCKDKNPSPAPTPIQGRSRTIFP